MNIIFFFTQKYLYLRDRFQELYAIQIGEMEIRKFPDGEKYQRIITDLRGHAVIIIGGTVDDEETLELYDLSCGAVECGAVSIELMIPFYGYSTMEKAVKSGEIVKAKSRATLLSSIPRASLATRIGILDLHVEGIAYYFEKTVLSRNIRAESMWVNWIKHQKLDRMVIASTDAGRAKWVEKLAQKLECEAAFIYKRRLSDSETEVVSINADVQNKNVIIYDDMIRTGSSVIEAIKSYQQAGASSVYVITTHGILLDNAANKILELGVKTLAMTNSHPNSERFLGLPQLEVLDITPLLMENIYGENSHY